MWPSLYQPQQLHLEINIRTESEITDWHLFQEEVWHQLVVTTITQL